MILGLSLFVGGCSNDQIDDHIISLQCAIFQRGFVMIFVSYFDRRNGADICSGKLPLIDYADLVAEYNTVFTF